MSGAKKTFSYQKFTVKDSAKSAAPKSKAKTDSVTKLKLLEDKYRSMPIQLAPGKSKAVAKTIVAKKAGKKAFTDAVAATPSKKAFFIGKKPIAFQG